MAKINTPIQPVSRALDAEHPAESDQKREGPSLSEAGPALHGGRAQLQFPATLARTKKKSLV